MNPSTHQKIEGRKITDYKTKLMEPSRPPSKGGNRSALHAHTLIVDGKAYGFLAKGSKQWVFKSDIVSFEFEINGLFKNVLKETLTTIDNLGNFVVRGDRTYKTRLRTTTTRPPVSRREQRD